MNIFLLRKEQNLDYDKKYMTYLSINTNSYKKKLPDPKKVKPVHQQDNKRSEDSSLTSAERKNLNNTDIEEKNPKEKNVHSSNSIGLSHRNSTALLYEVKTILYVHLRYPEEIILCVDYNTGDIITNVLHLPENYWRIICFETKTFPENKFRVSLHDVGYWASYNNKVYYLYHGKTVPLLKNKSI
tara:strand:- start:1072 stop:1626 length:555 start_codon:yes stop_codon:yes gene_type:complete